MDQSFGNHVCSYHIISSQVLDLHLLLQDFTDNEDDSFIIYVIFFMLKGRMLNYAW